MVDLGLIPDTPTTSPLSTTRRETPDILGVALPNKTNPYGGLKNLGGTLGDLDPADTPLTSWADSLPPGIGSDTQGAPQDFSVSCTFGK